VPALQSKKQDSQQILWKVENFMTYNVDNCIDCHINFFKLRRLTKRLHMLCAQIEVFNGGRKDE
jgi:hypothetical protein